MGKRFLISVIISIICLITASAQEQKGLVKTVGRPNTPGMAIENVLIRLQGTNAAYVSDIDGKFLLNLSGNENKTVYSLSRIHKPGYQLADAGVIGRKYPYSAEVPMEISMVSNEDFYKTKSEIEAKLRSVIEKEYRDTISNLQRRLDAKIIDSEIYGKELANVIQYYDNVDNLIDALSSHYAKTDYDKLDPVDAQINQLIELGKIEDAEALLDSKNTKDELEQIRVNNKRLSEALADGKTLEAQKVNEYARELKMRFDIASLRFDNFAAASALKERMELDSLNVDWCLEYASFIRDYLGQYEDADLIYDKLFKSETDNLLRSQILTAKGNLLYLQGKIDSSLDSYLCAVQLVESVDSSSQDLALLYNNIAGVLIEKNQYKRGEMYLQKSKELNIESGDSLGLASNLCSEAVLYGDYGMEKSTIELYKQALQIRQKIQGEKSLGVASIYANMAITMKRLNEFDLAYEYMNNAKEIHVEIMNENHPIVANDYIGLGSIEVEAGRGRDALRLYKKAEEILLEFHSERHPDMASLYNHYAHYFTSVETDIPKALQYYEKALEIHRKIYGVEHSSVALELQNIGALHSSVGNFLKAKEYYDAALNMACSIYGENHKLVADIYNNYARLLLKVEDYDAAKLLWDKALDIYMRIYGQEHMTVAIVYNNIGAYFDDVRRDHEAAIEYYNKALQINVELYGSTSPKAATQYDNIGCSYIKLEKYIEAEPYLIKGLQLRKDYYGEAHADVAVSYNNLAQLYSELKKYDKSEQMMLKTKDINVALLGEMHVSNTAIYSNLGLLYMRMEHYEQAIFYSLKALHLAEQYYGLQHENTLTYRYGVAYIYSNMGAYDKAVPYWYDTYSAVYQKYGKENGLTKDVLRRLYFALLEVMSKDSYDGTFDKHCENINKTTVITATVSQGSAAEAMGLSGVYEIVANDEWEIYDKKANYLVYCKSIANRAQKTWVLHRDGEFVKVTHEGSLGISIGVGCVAETEKAALIKSYSKWKKSKK